MSIQPAMVGLLLLLAGCKTAPEVGWQETMASRLASDTYIDRPDGFKIRYETGLIGYQLTLDGRTDPRNQVPAEEGTPAERILAPNVFNFSLNGQPLDMKASAFPNYGTAEFGTIIGEPLPGELLDLNPALVPIYEKAQSGSAESAFNLSKALFTLQNEEHPTVQPLGFYWILKAAEQGHPEALEDVATCYRYGNGVVKNYGNYLRYLEKAAQLRNYRASCQIAWEVATTRSASGDDLRKVQQYVLEAAEAIGRSGNADTLAVIEARMGNWEEAIRLGEEALSLLNRRWEVQHPGVAPDRKQKELVSALSRRLQYYKRNCFPEELFL